LAAERGGAERRQGARRSVAVPNGEGVASGGATEIYADVVFLCFSLENNTTFIILLLICWYVII
jgi:hypothetical protein